MNKKTIGLACVGVAAASLGTLRVDTVDISTVFAQPKTVVPEKVEIHKVPTSSQITIADLQPRTYTLSLYCPTEDSCVAPDYRNGRWWMYSGRGRVWYPITKLGHKECSYFEASRLAVWNACNRLTQKPATSTTSSGRTLIHECIASYDNRLEREICIMGW